MKRAIDYCYVKHYVSVMYQMLLDIAGGCVFVNG